MKRGFTLAENMLAFSLISLVLILLLNLFPSSMATVRRSEQRYQALTLADNMLERQASRPFSKLPVGTVEDSQQGDYKIHLEIVKAGDEDPAWLRTARVTVSWTYQSQSKEVTRELRLHRLANQL
ncbi:MAG: hypothetical protein U0931_27675 [Vulcanimicrobiota bacterium]